MPGETQQQYTTWLLYCEVGSIDKLLGVWSKVGQKADEIGIDFGSKLGTKPARSTLGEWSKKYRWVERTDLKLQEDMEAIRKRSEKIKKEKLHRIADAFEQITTKVLRRLRKGEEPTIAEWKQVWEMLRTELGENIGKHEIVKGIDESKQSPPTEEERELGKALDEAIKEHYRKQGLKRHEKDV